MTLSILPFATVNTAASDAGGFAGCPSAQEPTDVYDALLRRLRAGFVPFSVVWELTHTCNLRCAMCYNEPLAEPELDTRACFGALEQLASAGTLRLILTGGEILTRRDFFEIAAEARRLGFALDLKTNGTLITPAVADRIAALAPLQVDISLLGAASATFDAIAGVRNTHARVAQGVALLRERGVRVKLNTLLMDLNIAERQQMVDLALSMGAQYEQVLKISPSDTGRRKAGDAQLSVKQMVDALAADRTSRAPQPPSGGRRPCLVGLSSCLISPYGVVYPCVELRIAAGDLQRQPFAEIWRDAPIFRELRDPRMIERLPECRECALQAYCEGRCAGISWKESGDFYRGHTLACRHAQARFEQHCGTPAPDTPFLAKHWKTARKSARNVEHN